jgi:hypothetical protein
MKKEEKHGKKGCCLLVLQGCSWNEKKEEEIEEKNKLVVFLRGSLICSVVSTSLVWCGESEWVVDRERLQF